MPLTQDIFLRLLALSYFFSFLSLYTQVLGLFGSRGIVPIAYHQKDYKTLFYWNSSDAFLKSAACIGVIISLFPIASIMSPIAFGCLWFLYFSFYQVGYPFLSFQWDALLVETGFLGFFYSLASPPPLLLHIAIWVLLFKLMVSSGLVKWMSACPKWRAFVALDYHFETQPLPNLGGFFAHHLVKRGTKIVALLVFAFEILVPLLYFGPFTMRAVGSVLTIFFQFLIILTGNYAFFNLLTIALCIPLFEVPPLGSNILLNLLGALYIFYTIMLLFKQFFPSFPNIWGINYLRSLGILNTYGLFAVMTTIRDEIIIEGSLDGTTWKEYVFKYKPGITNEGMKQIAPFHPRIDWQMWFSSLSTFRTEYWFQLFVQRLLQGSKEVLDLLKENPFPESPPKYLRAERYRFHFHSIHEWRKTGKFWTKEYIGPYLPVIERR